MSAFDKIAKSAPSAPGKKSSVIAAVVPKNVAKSIDEYVTIKTSIKSEEADLKVLETQIIECLREQQDKLAYSGQFTKSLLAEGLTQTARVTYVTSDRFTIPQDEASLAEIKRIVGAAYDNMFETKRVISMNKDALENEILLD